MGCQISTQNTPEPSQASPCDTKLQHGINQLKHMKYSLDQINGFEIYFKYQSDNMKNEIIYNSFTLDLVEHVLMKNQDFKSNITSTRQNRIQLHDKLIWYIECVDQKDRFCPQTTFNQIIDKNDNWKKDIDREKHREYYYLSALYYLFMGDLKDIDEQNITTTMCVFTDFVNIDCKQPELDPEKESNWEKLLRLLFIGFDFEKIIEIMRLQTQGDLIIENKHNIESMKDLINMVELPNAVGRGKSKKKNIYNKCRSKSKKYKQQGGVIDPMSIGLITIGCLTVAGLWQTGAIATIAASTGAAAVALESIASTNIGALTGVFGGAGLATAGIIFAVGIAAFCLTWKLTGGAAFVKVTQQRRLRRGEIEGQKEALMADIIQKATARDGIEESAMHQIGINRGTIYKYIEDTTGDMINEFMHFRTKLMTCINNYETCIYPHPKNTTIKYNIDTYNHEVEKLHSEITQYKDWLKTTLLSLLSTNTQEQFIKTFKQLDNNIEEENEDNVMFAGGMAGGNSQNNKDYFVPIQTFYAIFGHFEDRLDHFLERRLNLTNKFEIQSRYVFTIRLKELERHKESMENALTLINQRFWSTNKRVENLTTKAVAMAKNRELGRDEIYNNIKGASKIFSEKLWHEIAADREQERGIYRLAKIAQIQAVQEGATAAVGQVEQFSDFVIRSLEKTHGIMSKMTAADRSGFQDEIKKFVLTHEPGDIQDVQEYLNKLAKEKQNEIKENKKRQANDKKKRKQREQDRLTRFARDSEAMNTKPRNSPRHTSRSTPRHTSRHTSNLTSRSTPRHTSRHTSNLTSIDEEIYQLKEQMKAIKKKHTKAKEDQDNVTRKKLKKQHEILIKKLKRLESQKNSHTPEPKPNNEEYSNSEEYSSDDEPRIMREPTPMRKRRSNTPMRQRRSNTPIRQRRLRKSNNNTLTPLQRRAIQMQARQMNNNNNSNY